MKQAKRDLENKLALFHNEVLSVQCSFYVHMKLEEHYGIPMVFDVFWLTIYNDVLAQIYITLGSIFQDDVNDSFSIYHLFKFCKANRKLFPVNISDRQFRGLERRTNKWKEIYNKKYRPIRNQIFAHKDLHLLGRENKLFSKTSFGEVEKMINFLLRIWDTFNQAYTDGKSPDVMKSTYGGDKNSIIHSTESVINIYLAKYTSNTR